MLQSFEKVCACVNVKASHLSHMQGYVLMGMTKVSCFVMRKKCCCIRHSCYWVGHCHKGIWEKLLCQPRGTSCIQKQLIRTA